MNTITIRRADIASALCNNFHHPIIGIKRDEEFRTSTNFVFEDTEFLQNDLASVKKVLGLKDDAPHKSHHPTRSRRGGYKKDTIVEPTKGVRDGE